MRGVSWTSKRTSEHGWATRSDHTSPATAVPGRGGRMSRQRKTTAVLRLMRGEDLELVPRSLGVAAATLPARRDAFLAAGEFRQSNLSADNKVA